MKKIYNNIIISFVILIILIVIWLIVDNSFVDKNLKQGNSKWTFIIYMSGDNDLSEMVSKNRGLLKSVGSTDDLTIIALMDQENNGDTKLGLIKLRNVNETELSVLDSNYTNELNMGDEKTLENFVTWGMDTYPNQHYCLIIWGHGKGWRGVAKDNDDYLTMAELNTALRNIVEHNNGEKLDIIGFDACGMGMLEVFYQVQDYTDIVIASEKDIPERGWPYYDILQPLKEDPDMSPKEFSKLIVDKYTKSYSLGKVDSEGYSVGLTAVDLSKIDRIVDNLEFESTNQHQLQYYEEEDYTDLFRYAQINGFKDLMKAINASIIAESHWVNPEDPIDYAYGMTIYYPDKYDQKYDKLAFARDTQWDDWLRENI